MKPLYYSSLLFSRALSLPPSLPLVAGSARARDHPLARKPKNKRRKPNPWFVSGSDSVFGEFSHFDDEKKWRLTLGHFFSSLESDPVGQFWLNPLVAIANPPTSQISKNRIFLKNKIKSKYWLQRTRKYLFDPPVFHPPKHKST
jgi:hypothetical protein